MDDPIKIQFVKERLPLWLILDYDGTLADFAPTPDDVLPDASLINLIQKLADCHQIRVTILSGRRLSHIEKLMPIEGILLAGTYGLEMRLQDGSHQQRLAYERIRPVVERLKPEWQDLIWGCGDFFLEDKGWSLALHGRYASEQDAQRTIDLARAIGEKLLAGQDFVLQGGNKFLEAAPRLANKANAVDYLISEFELPNAHYIYLGDDDKDEAAFTVIQRLGGLAGKVGPSLQASGADFRLSSPTQARKWLSQLRLLYTD